MGIASIKMLKAFDGFTHAVSFRPRFLVEYTR